MRLRDLCKGIQTNGKKEGSLYNPLLGITFHYPAVKFGVHSDGNNLLN